MSSRQHVPTRVTLGLAGVFLISACTAAPAAQGPTAAPEEVTGELTVLDWAGYDAPEFWTDFQETYPAGVRVESRNCGVCLRYIPGPVSHLKYHRICVQISIDIRGEQTVRPNAMTRYP